MNPLVIKGASMAAVAKAKMPLIKTAGKTVVSFVLTSGTGKELMDKFIETRERNKIIKDFDDKYNLAQSTEEKDMILKHKMQYVNRVMDITEVQSC